MYIGVVFLCMTPLIAQDTISVSYESPKDAFVQKLMGFQGIFGFDVIVRTSHKNLPYKLYMVRCTDGKTERKALNEEIRFFKGNAHGCKYNGKGLIRSAHFCLTGNLSRQIGMGKTGR